MGYFDFLAKLGGGEEEALRKKKAVPSAAPGEPAPFVGPPATPEETPTLETPAPPDTDSMGIFQRRRGQARDEAFRRAQAAVAALEPKENPQVPMSDYEFGTLDKSYDKEGLLTKLRGVEPENYSKVIAEGAGRKPQEIARHLLPVEQAVSEYRRLQYAPEARAIEANLANQDAQTLRKSIALRDSAISKIDEQIPYAGGVVQQADLMGQRESLMSLQAAAKARLSQKEATLGRNSIQEQLRDATGSEEKRKAQAYDLYLELKKKLPQLDLDGQLANPALAMATIVKAFGEDAQERVFGPIADLYEDSTKPIQEEAGKLGEEAESQRTKRTALKEELRARQKELYELSPMHSTGGVFLYVLASLVLGPHLAALFFINRERAGELEQDIKDLREEIRGTEEEERAALHAQRQARLQAAHGMAQESREKNLLSMRMAEMRRNHPQGKDPALDKAFQAYNSAESQVRRLEDQLESLEKMLPPPSDVSARKAGIRNALVEARRKADFLNDIYMRRLKMVLPELEEEDGTGRENAPAGAASQTP